MTRGRKEYKKPELKQPKKSIILEKEEESIDKHTKLVIESSTTDVIQTTRKKRHQDNLIPHNFTISLELS